MQPPKEQLKCLAWCPSNIAHCPAQLRGNMTQVSCLTLQSDRVYTEAKHDLGISTSSGR